jgi:hypothetical protein
VTDRSPPDANPEYSPPESEGQGDGASVESTGTLPPASENACKKSLNRGADGKFVASNPASASPKEDTFASLAEADRRKNFRFIRRVRDDEAVAMPIRFRAAELLAMHSDGKPSAAERAGNAGVAEPRANAGERPLDPAASARRCAQDIQRSDAYGSSILYESLMLQRDGSDYTSPPRRASLPAPAPEAEPAAIASPADPPVSPLEIDSPAPPQRAQHEESTPEFAAPRAPRPQREHEVIDAEREGDGTWTAPALPPPHPEVAAAMRTMCSDGSPEEQRAARRRAEHTLQLRYHNEARLERDAGRHAQAEELLAKLVEMGLQ